MIKAIIFDVGGVLIKWDSAWVTDDIALFYKKDKKEVIRVYNKLIHILGKGEISENVFWKLFEIDLGINKRLSYPKESLLMTGYRENFQINREMMELVLHLKKIGYKTAILSDTNIVHVKLTEKKGIFKSFDEVVLSHKVGTRKPDPKIFRIVLKKLRIKPSEAIFIDDIKEYVTASKKLGINGIHFRNAKRLKKDLIKTGIII